MITVEVLFFHGCPNLTPTLELARSVVTELGVAAEVREVAVEELGRARGRRIGSPGLS